jgi:formiminotetrahydrofolate cyclodeaminase
MSGPPGSDQLRSLPLAEVLGRLAAPTPAPGGGSAAGLACALAAALVEMSAGFESAADAESRRTGAAQARARALELAELDLSSYEPVLRALRRPAGDPERPARLAEALSAAAAVPFGISQVAGEVTAQARAATDAAGRHVRGDCATAAVLAGAACRAAALLVEINLHGTDDPRRAEAENLVRTAIVDSEHAVQRARES